MEVGWTGFQSFRVRNLKLTGTSSLWMFPIYGSAAFLRPLMQYFQKKEKPFWKRGFFYMLLIYLGEFLSGSLLKKYQFCPWDYSHCRFQFHKVIRLDFAPLWFFSGLLFERILLKNNKNWS